MQKNIIKEELVWDAKRVIIAISISALVIGGGAIVAKTLYLDKTSLNKNQTAGEVAGEETKEDRVIKIPTEREVEDKIEIIKQQVSELKPEDIAKQEPVREILKELDRLKATASSQLTEGTKNMVCDEAKRLFCK